MRFIHLSDLHLGMKLNGFSLIECQRRILEQILEITDAVHPDAVLIAGDIFDKPIPSVEAIRLLELLLDGLSHRRTETFLISGNHDSRERLAYGAKFFSVSGIHFVSDVDDAFPKFTFQDSYGKCSLFLLPFFKPSEIQHQFEDKEIHTYTDAMRYAIEGLDIDLSERNVLMAHQFVTGAQISESEDSAEIFVGGTENVDASVFEPFDYVALGHIHSPQNIGSSRIRYCGTPLKYSFSEAKQQKSVTVVELREKGNLSVSEVPLVPMTDMSELKGPYDQLISRSFYEKTSYPDDFVHITLTDEEDIPDAAAKLRTVYRNLMKLDYDNVRTRSMGEITVSEKSEQKTPFDYFNDLYTIQNGKEMNEEQNAFVRDLMSEVWDQ